jgi:hypothetical protein
VRRSLLLPTFASLCALACGGGSEGPEGDASVADAADGPTVTDASDATLDAPQPGDASHEADAPFKEAKHALPTVPFNGGPVIAHPMLVTITFSDDPDRAYDEALGAFLVQSTWLETVGKEYGVGLGTHQVVELGPSPAQIDDQGIQALLLSLIQSGKAPDLDGGAPVPPPIPPSDDAGPDAGPDDAALEDAGDGGRADGETADATGDAPAEARSTADANGSDGGSDATGADGGGDGGTFLLPPVVYMIYFPTTTAVTVVGQPLCVYSDGGYHYQIQETLGDQTFAYAVISACAGQGPPHELLQFAASHELIEACTDPATSAPAYTIQDPSSPWSLFGGEVGDMCSFIEPQWTEGMYDQLQRVYSNAAAADGGDPCVPAPAMAAYYATDVEPQAYVALDAGQSTTFTVTGWSTAAVSPWSVAAVAYISSPPSFQPIFSLPATMLGNGQKSTLAVGIPAGTPSGSYALLLVESSQSQTDFTSSLVGVYVP